MGDCDGPPSTSLVDLFGYRLFIEYIKDGHPAMGSDLGDGMVKQGTTNAPARQAMIDEDRTD